MKISVCIPTYKRPDLLMEAINSSLRQTHAPFEILVGDDSPDQDTEKLIRNYLNQAIPVHYWHHQPSLGQAANVRHLFQQATGDVITLLHDDDRFRPGAFEILVRPLVEHPEVIATFGKQIIISEDGLEDLGASINLNDYFNRTAATGGRIENAFEAGVISMFPNNGYFVRKEIIQQIDYLDGGVAGKACDYYFGLRIGNLDKSLWFCDAYTADYRLTEVSSARSGSNSAFYGFKLALAKLPSHPVSPNIRKVLQDKVKAAIVQGSVLDWKTAWKWYFSEWHRSAILTLGGLKRLLILLKNVKIK